LDSRAEVHITVGGADPGGYGDRCADQKKSLVRSPPRAWDGRSGTEGKLSFSEDTFSPYIKERFVKKKAAIEKPNGRIVPPSNVGLQLTDHQARYMVV